MMHLLLFTGCLSPIVLDSTSPIQPSIEQEISGELVVAEYEPLSANELVILHTNDLHGHFLPERAPWLDDSPSIGGFVAIDYYVSEREERFGESNVLLLDGGDILTGTPLTDMVVRGSQGGAMLEFMEAVGYDAWVVGNHEFDKGFENISRLVLDSRIPVLSSNLNHPETEGTAIDGLLRSVVLSTDSFEVGVVGATTMGLGHLASADTMSNIALADVTSTVAQEVARLDESTDVIIVLSHIGLDADKALAEAVPGIDLIVGGHSHTHLDEPVKVAETWIVQAGSYGRSIGEVRLTVESDRVVAFSGALNDLPEMRGDEVVDTEVGRLTSQYREAIESEYGQVVGEAAGDFGRNYNHESSLGMWVTDLLREELNTDLGLYNAGGIRSDIVAGPLTPNDIFNVFPFSNQVVTFEVTGAELMAMFVQNAHAEAFEDRGALQISGANVVWRIRMDSPEVVSAHIGDEAIEADRLYTVATNSYLHDQADRYMAGANPVNMTPSGRTVFEVAMERVRAGLITPPTTSRFVQQD